MTAWKGQAGDGRDSVILALDTSGDQAVVALTDDTGARRFAGVGSQPRHAELAPRCWRWQVGPATAVVASPGSGSFTGLRVGLAFAGVFGWARGIPVRECVRWIRWRWPRDSRTAGRAGRPPRELFAARLIGPGYARSRRSCFRGPRRPVSSARNGQWGHQTAHLGRSAQPGTTVIDPDALATSAARVLATGADGSLQPTICAAPM